MSPKNLVRMTLLSAVAAGLCACGGHGSGGGSVSTTPTANSPASHFGAQFATDFQAAANSQPVKPAPGDIIALDLTAQPYALH